jgi:uncharacterized protein (TIGR03437 family)
MGTYLVRLAQRSAWFTFLATALITLTCSPPVWAQTSQPTILQIDLENFVRYVVDTSDTSRFATIPVLTPAVVPKDFGEFIAIADIVAVNGQPAKGTYMSRGRTVSLRPVPNPGEVIADTNRSGAVDTRFEILSADGTVAIGTILGLEIGGGSPPPGAPLSVTQGNNAIVGGTGAYLAARGYFGQRVSSLTVPVRMASIAEDPANRRTNGGGRAQFVLQVIPMEAPQILSSAAVMIPETGVFFTGPAVFHSDFSPVTAAKPARAGEILISMAAGMGPTVPGVDPGKPFPTWPDHPLQQINSPVNVTVNGQPADVINAIGWPNLVGKYRVDFRVPNAGASGMIAIQLSAAWIQGPPVTIPIQ